MPAIVLTHVSDAAEGGIGFYLLGSKGPAAAIMPPPGLFQNDLYCYSGGLGGDVELPSRGRLALGVQGGAVIELPTVLWVLPEEVAGGISD